MTTELLFFLIFAIGAVAGALGVLAAKNPVNSAVSLVASFFCLAGTYILLHAEFMAILQIMVYAGAIMVLFTFVLMLLNIRTEDVGKPHVNSTKVLGVVSAAGILTALLSAVVYTAPVGQVLLPEMNVDGFGRVSYIGQMMMTRFILPFEMASILLLVGIVSAVVIAKRRL